MREQTLTLNQIILNKANSKEDFTYIIDKEATGRYVVATESLYKGANPSIDRKLRLKISEALIHPVEYDSIGGWMSPEGEYYLDANWHLEDLDKALYIGEVFKQLAIYDTLEDKVIFI